MLGAEALAQRSARDFHLPMVERAARERYDYGRDRGNKIVQVCALASIHKSFQLQLPQLQFAFEGRGQGVAHADLPPKHRRSDVFSRHAIELACRPMDWLGFWLALARRNGIAGSVIGGVEGGLLGISAIMARRRQEASGTTSSKNQHGLTRACRDQGVQRGLPKYVVPRPWDPPHQTPRCVILGPSSFFPAGHPQQMPITVPMLGMGNVLKSLPRTCSYQNTQSSTRPALSHEPFARTYAKIRLRALWPARGPSVEAMAAGTDTPAKLRSPGPQGVAAPKLRSIGPQGVEAPAARGRT